MFKETGREGERGAGTKEEKEKERKREREKRTLPSYVSPKFPLQIWRHNILLMGRFSQAGVTGVCALVMVSLLLTSVPTGLPFQGFIWTRYPCQSQSHHLQLTTKDLIFFYSILSPSLSPLLVTSEASWLSVAYEPLRTSCASGATLLLAKVT